MDHEEHEPKLFSLSEAETARRHVEPLLIEAMEGNREMEELDEKLNAISNRILIMGGITIDYEVAARVRSAHNRTVAKVRDALDQIHAIGCVVKDLESGLVDFPAVLKNEEVYLCWRLGRRPHPVLSPPGRRFFRAQADRSGRYRPATPDPIKQIPSSRNTRVRKGMS